MRAYVEGGQYYIINESRIRLRLSSFINLIISPLTIKYEYLQLSRLIITPIPTE